MTSTFGIDPSPMFCKNAINNWSDTSRGCEPPKKLIMEPSMASVWKCLAGKYATPPPSSCHLDRAQMGGSEIRNKVERKNRQKTSFSRNNVKFRALLNDTAFTTSDEHTWWSAHFPSLPRYFRKGRDSKYGISSVALNFDNRHSRIVGVSFTAPTALWCPAQWLTRRSGGNDTQKERDLCDTLIV